MYHMFAEISEEPDVVYRTLVHTRTAVTKLADIIRESGTIFVAGSGSSFHAALFLQSILLSMGKVAVAFQSSQNREFISEYIPQDSLMVIFSNSGESTDSLEALKRGRNIGIRVVGVTCSGASRLARDSNFSIDSQSGEEKAIPATKSYLSQLAVSVAIGAALRRMDVEVIPAIAKRIASEALKDNTNVSKLAKLLGERVVVLGSGINYQAALESALKLRETAGIQTEGFAHREYLHGYLQTLDHVTAIISLVRQHNEEDEMVLSKLSSHSRSIIRVGSPITDAAEPLSDFLRTIGLIVRIQMLSYFVALNRGLDPDNPSRLSKVVR